MSPEMPLHRVRPCLSWTVNEASRHKVSALQDEVRHFKTASQHKLQALEMQQLREHDAAVAKQLREAEDELKALRGGAEKRLAEVESQRSREMEVHERRIVKLMSVIEALTTAGDERTDMRVLSEKMNQLREVSRECGPQPPAHTALPKPAHI